MVNREKLLKQVFELALQWSKTVERFYKDLDFK